MEVIKKHKLVADNGNHFVVQDSEGNEFKIAKHALDPLTHEKVANLQKVENYDDGGEVDIQQDIPLDQSQAESDASSAIDREPQSETDIQPAKKPKTDLSTFQQSAQKIPVVGGVSEGVPATSTQGLVPELQNAANLQQESLFTGLKAQKQYGADVASIEAKAAKQYADVADLTQQHLQDLSNDRKSLHDDILSSKIDPNQWVKQGVFGSSGAGQVMNRVFAAIGMALGGMGAHWTGGRNLAADTLNDAINRNIEAQKQDLSNKNTLYARNLEATRNELEADRNTRAQLATIYDAMMHKAAARAMTPQALAAYQQQSSALQQQIFGWDMQSAQYRALSQAMQGGGNLGGINPMLLPKEYQDRMVQLPQIPGVSNGESRIALSSESAKEAKTATADFAPIYSYIKQLGDLAQQGPTLPLTQARKKYDVLRQQLVLEGGKLHGINRLNPSEVEAMEKSLPTEWNKFLGTAPTAIEALQSIPTEKLRSIYGAHIYNYKSPQALKTVR